MIKTNCELPKDLIDKNLELNSMDLVLFHLYDSYEWYREYYKNLRKTHPNRTMILDNSEYEYFVKGIELDLNRYCEVINELNPDYYILPDVLMDREGTMEKIDEFNRIHKDSIKVQSIPMGVIQGNSSIDFSLCAQEMYGMGIKNIAIPFHNSFFKEMDVIDSIKNYFKYNYQDRCEDDIKYSMGRVAWIMGCARMLKQFDYIHVLGSHCPIEKFFYNYIVNSMDTGYPVKCGIAGYELLKEPHKPNIIIDDFLEDKLDESKKSLIEKNIEVFKNM